MDKKPRRLQYSHENMLKALEAVQNGMPKSQASKLFGVPRTTLIGKVQGKVPIERKIGPDTILTKEEEELLVKWIFHIAANGFPATKTQLLDSVQMLMKSLKRPNPFTNGRPGKRWYGSFLKRHPELAERVSQNLTSCRANLTEEKIRGWFKEIGEYLQKMNNFHICQDPTRIYNCDESAFFLSPKEDHVLVKKGEKTVYNFISNDEQECLTSLFMCSASGLLPPPMVIFSYKRVPKHVTDKFPKNWGFGRSDNGWMTGETFYEYIANVFHPWLLHQKIELPIILYVDGHTSHMTLELSEFCSKNNIILIALYPNSTHMLQPLDVGVFRELKREWKKSIHNWRITNNGVRLTREYFASILQDTVNRVENLSTIVQNAFRACGLSPFSPDAIKFSKYIKSNMDVESTTTQPDSINLKEYETFIKVLKREVPQKVSAFQASGDTWTGDVKDTELFYVWQSICHRFNNVNIGDDDANPLNLKSNENASGGLPKDGIENSIGTQEPQPTLKNIVITEVDDLENRDEEKEDIVDIEYPSYIFDPGEDFSFCEKLFDEFDESKGTNDESLKLAPIEDVPNGNNSLDVHNVPASPDVPRVADVIDIPDMASIHNIEAHQDENNKVNGLENVTPESKKQEKPLTIDGLIVPSPFKNSLFWPTPKPSQSNRKRGNKEKIPSVVVANQWQDYHRKKREAKDLDLKQKEEKKNHREQRKLEKEEKSSLRKKLTNADEEDCSKDEDSDSIEEQPLENNNFLLYHFVIVDYNGEYFPGKIVEIKDDSYNKQEEDEEGNYKISHMEKRGRNWIWPTRCDEVWYDKDEIIMKILPPKPKNKRGLFEVSEMCNFV